MRKFIYAVLSLSPLLFVGGCVSSMHTFRNREFDYLHTTVTQRPPLRIPAGLKKIKFQPALTIPPGQSTFGPSKNINLLPPGIHAWVAPTKKTTLLAKKSTKRPAGNTL